MKKIIACLLVVPLAAVLFVLYVFNRNEANIFIVGDILLSRGVGEKISQHGPEYPYLNIKNLLPKADIAFGNLECPITSNGNPAVKRPYYLFKGDLYNADALKDAGFKILNLANNHTMDYGRVGILDTIEALKSSTIKTVGAGENKESAHKPEFIEVSGTIIGFLGFSAFPTEGYVYLENKPDVAQLDLNSLADEVKTAKAKCDILIVSFHWGKEFQNYPNKSQNKAAHLSIESGADIVVGHHPHVLQGMEFYRDKPIFYSLGNFVFDKQVPKGTDQTVILKVKVINKSINNLEITPIKIVECQPSIPQSNEEALNILNNFEGFSKSINTNVQVDRKGIKRISNATFYQISTLSK